ncbi:MAG: serine/threonine protein kinase [Planctomycetota bacterium]|jgi:serine/threonine-protein kinase
MPQEAAESIPESIGKYQIIRKLADGLCGPVYMGSAGDLKVAVKVPNPEIAMRLESASRFTGEIKHENIIPYKEIEYTKDGSPVFVMDYFEIKPVHFRLFAGRSRIEMIDSIAKVADALAAAHEKGAVHGNIKPSNVFIRRAGNKFMPLVGDFGISYIWNPSFFSGIRFRGVLPYMAPEVIKSISAGADPQTINISASADIYSLTTVLVELLTGHALFEGISDLENLLEAKKSIKYRLLTINYPYTRVDINKLNSLVSANLSPDPDKRMSSATEYRNILNQVILPEPVTADSPGNS